MFRRKKSTKRVDKKAAEAVIPEDIPEEMESEDIIEEEIPEDDDDTNVEEKIEQMYRERRISNSEKGSDFREPSAADEVIRPSDLRPTTATLRRRPSRPETSLGSNPSSPRASSRPPKGVGGGGNRRPRTASGAMNWNNSAVQYYLSPDTSGVGQNSSRSSSRNNNSGFDQSIPPSERELLKHLKRLQQLEREEKWNSRKSAMGNSHMGGGRSESGKKFVSPYSVKPYTVLGVPSNASTSNGRPQTATTSTRRPASSSQPRKPRPFSAAVTSTTNNSGSGSESPYNNPSASPRNPFAGARNGGRPMSAPGKVEDGVKAASERVTKARASQRRHEDVQRRTFVERSRELMHECVENVRLANRILRRMGEKRHYKTFRPSAQQGGKPAEVRVAVYEGAEQVRDISIELFTKEFQRLRVKERLWQSSLRVSRITEEQFVETQERESLRDSTRSENTRTRKKAIQKETKDKLRSVLLDTIQLTSKLSEQLAELDEKGTNQSPYAPV